MWVRATRLKFSWIISISVSTIRTKVLCPAANQLAEPLRPAPYVPDREKNVPEAALDW